METNFSFNGHHIDVRQTAIGAELWIDGNFIKKQNGRHAVANLKMIGKRTVKSLPEPLQSGGISRELHARKYIAQHLHQLDVAKDFDEYGNLIAPDFLKELENPKD